MEDHQARQHDHSQFQRMPHMVPSTQSGEPQDSSSAYGQLRHQAASPASQPDLERDQGQTGYTYPQSHHFQPQMQDQTLHYGGEFGNNSGRQQFQPYTQTLLYNMASPVSQPAGYEAVQQFVPRQSSAIEVLSNQFNVPQFFPSDEHTSRASQQTQSYLTSGFQQPTNFSHRTSTTNSTVSSQYIASVTETSSATLSAIMAPVDLPSTTRRSADDNFSEFNGSLRQVLRAIHHGDLLRAGHQLLQVSEWISGRAAELGLTRDDQVPYNQRLELWDNFNLCWLALLQRQKNDSQDMIDRGQPPPLGQTILQEDMLERMARELVRLCDGLERHGLVDYQMGVWEEEIMNVLLECLQLLEGDLEEYSVPDIPSSQSRHARAVERTT